MKVGDLVRWTEIEQVYHIACAIGFEDLVEVRQRGVILDKNPKYFFVFWENGDYRAQPSSDLEVISEA